MAKKKNISRYLIVAAVVLVVLAIVGNKLGWFGKGETIQVATEKVVVKEITAIVSASGKIQPEAEVKLSSEVSGEIVQLAVKEGDFVKRGQLLCKIRPDILESGYNRTVASLNTQKASLASAKEQLRQAEANFKNTAASYKRSAELYKQKVLSASEYDAAQAQYLSAKANLESLKQNIVGSQYGVQQAEAVVKEASDNLSRTTIYAPADGVISLLSVELGERVVGTAQMAGTEIMRIANMTSMEVNVDVNENDITRVKVGNPAEIEVDAYPGKKFKGSVTEIASSAKVQGATADQVTNFTVKVRISPDSYADLMKKNPALQSPFKPGLSATVDIQTENNKGLCVPIQSVTTRDEVISESGKQSGEDGAAKADKKDSEKPKVTECVYIYQKDNTVKEVKVTTGIQNDTYIRILSGLKGGEEVVSAPFNAISKSLKDGTKVEKVSKDKLFDGTKK